jgi:flagellar M-ring protein FliF
VERSVHVVKENEASKNSATRAPTTVAQELPEEETAADTGEQSSAENDRREEITNYELSSKTVTTVSEGYAIESLSIAVVVNRARIAAALGDSATPEAIDAELVQIEQLIVSATGFRSERGDKIKVSAVNFLDAGAALEPVPPVGMKELLLRQSGTFINAATILLVALLLIWFGLRPATRAILARPQPETAEAPGGERSNAAAGEAVGGSAQGAALASPPEANLIEDLTNKLKRSPQKRLEQLVQFDDEQAAAILKQWIHQGAEA